MQVSSNNNCVFATAGGLVLALFALFGVGGGVQRVGENVPLTLGTTTKEKLRHRQFHHRQNNMMGASVVYVPVSSEAGDGSGARKTFFSSRRGGEGVRDEDDDDDDVQLTYREVVRLWRESSGFRDVFIESLRRENFSAFFWETPPVTRDTMDRAYEHVVTSAPNLVGVSPEPEVFAEHLNKAAGCGATSIATFLNLGGDAVLVAPCESDDDLSLRRVRDGGAHLASFLRGAPAKQSHALLEAVGAAVEARVGEAPLWVSTSGSGVSWLHVRLDERPKYYMHQPYARWPQQALMNRITSGG